MLKYRGHLYREAITPEQKEKKKDYLLQQALQSGKSAPSWEQVREKILKGMGADAYQYRVEDAESTYADGGSDYLNDRVLEILKSALGLKAVPDPFPETTDDWEEVVEAWEDETEDNSRRRVRTWMRNEFGRRYKMSLSQTAAELAIRAAILEQLFKEDEERYKYILRQLKQASKLKCYRLISLPEDVSPTSLDSVGIYWSLDEDTVGLYEYDEDVAEQRGAIWRLAAKVNPENVNEWDTVMQYMSPEFGRAENEIRFHKHGRIYVEYAERIEGYDHEDSPSLKYSDYDVVDRVDIKAWRRA